MPGAIGLARATAISHCRRVSQNPPSRSFEISGRQFFRRKPFQIISGEMHYVRILREYSHARLKMACAMTQIYDLQFLCVLEPARAQNGHI